MATTTTNYGFDIPQSTDLVKDGATAIATLGQDIDTAMNTALGTKKAGMVLLNTTSFSGVSSANIDNLFSATYRNYKIVLAGKVASGDADITMKFRKAGSTTTDSNYIRQYLHSTGASVNSGLVTGQTFARIGNLGSTQSGVEVTLYSPFLSESTILLGSSPTSTNTTSLRLEAGAHTTTDSYDGIQVAPTSSTITGQISIYGWNE
jgi:hypothetical protein